MPVENTLSVLRAMAREQLLMEWYRHTRGERSMVANTYVGRERCFSSESIAEITEERKKSRDPAERRAWGFVRSHLLSERLYLELAPYDNRAYEALSRWKLDLPWLPSPLPYPRVREAIAQEPDPQRRLTMVRTRADLWRRTLNPIFDEKAQHARAIAHKLGFDNLVAMGEQIRWVSLPPLLEVIKEFSQKTEPAYQALLHNACTWQLGITPDQMRMSDNGRLRRAPKLMEHLPNELLLPTLRFFLEGLGLSLKTCTGQDIVIDVADHPNRVDRAACFAPDLPSDVRVSIPPGRGLTQFTVLFHEAGHAMHFSQVRAKPWAYRYVGPKAYTEALAMIFEQVWADPVWLERFRSFVADYNRQAGTSIPLMSDQDIERLAELVTFDNLYHLRSLGLSKIPFEAAVHGGDEALWWDLAPVPADELPSLYAALQSHATGIHIDEHDAQSYWSEVDDSFYSADYAQAFMLAPMIHDHLREQFGRRWYENSDVGPYLIERFYQHGSAPQPAEVAQWMGHEALHPGALEARLPSET